MSKGASSPKAIQAWPKVSPDGPRLGSVANVTPILESPSQGAKIVGYLHAGGTVARNAEPVGTQGCPGGWYPVYPKGVVCVGGAATLDLKHPTLLAMALQPKLDAHLPFTYARTRRDTALLEVHPQAQDSVLSRAELPLQSGLAVIGSWNARDEQQKSLRLAMMTDGRFVDAEQLEASEPSTFQGVALGEKRKLPVAFVVKRGVRTWSIEGQNSTQASALDYHQQLSLTGKTRSISGERFWALESGRWVRHRDVTVIQARNEFPGFVSGSNRWVDVSVLAGTAVLYEGKKPVYATLVSVGKDRLGSLDGTDLTERGEFPVVFKHITAVAADPKRFASKVAIHDVPWALELSSGQWLHGAYWHDRFGIEHGPGNIQLAPADAAHVWRWAGPTVPAGWHGVASDAAQENQTIVNVRK